MRATSRTHQHVEERIGLFPALLIGALILIVCSTIAETQTPCGRPRCGQQKNSRHNPHNRNSNSKAPAPDPAATLTIETEPDSTITLVGNNWRTSGSTDEKGIYVGNIKPKEEVEIAASKPGYEDGHTSVTLEPSEKRRVEIKLVAKDGALTVTLDVADADIFVSGKGSYKNTISRLQVPAGNYSINVSKFCYQNESRSVAIPPGQNVSVPITLTLLPIDSLLTLAEEQWQKKNYADATTAIKHILATSQSHARANLLMGQIVLLTEKISASAPYFLVALAGGEQIILPISFHSGAYYPGYLSLSSKDLQFHSSEQNGPAFSIPAHKLYSVEMNAGKGYRLRVTARVPGNKKEEKKNFDFHSSSGTSPNMNCRPCGDELELLHTLMMRIIK